MIDGARGSGQNECRGAGWLRTFRRIRSKDPVKPPSQAGIGHRWPDEGLDEVGEDHEVRISLRPMGSILWPQMLVSNVLDSIANATVVQAAAYWVLDSDAFGT